ncbi:MAG: APC family permease [Gammaproteobacteria bacterium]|nr:APC family permease [Gammaproteobacteria bacterium]
MNRTAQPGLGRWQLFAAAIGVAVAQLGMVAMGQGMALGGWGFFAALGIIFVLMLANVMAYAEMALMMPTAGSLSSYAEAAIGNFPAILLVFAGYVTPALFGLPVELILANGILRDVLPIGVPVYTWPCVIVLLFLGLNILGTDVFARVQTALSYVVLVFLLVTGLVAFSGQAAAPLPAGPDSGWAALSAQTAVIGVLALGFWTFCGLEFVTPLVGDARNPDRDLPRAMIGGLVAIFVAELLFAAGYLFFVPRETLLGSATPHLAYVMGVYGPWARIPFAVLALIATSSLINTVIAGVSRMLWGMAHNGQVFPLFRYRHPRLRTPVVAMVFVAALPLIGVVWSGGDPNAILSLTVAASVAWILAYVMAQVSLLVLRRRYPHLRRPYRMPFSPVLPLLAIAGMIFVVLNSAPTPELAPVIWKALGAVLLVFALVDAWWVKFFMKKGWFEPTLPESMQGRGD